MAFDRVEIVALCPLMGNRGSLPFVGQSLVRFRTTDWQEVGDFLSSGPRFFLGLG